ncbi:MAG: preprotein translocase subunit SecA, partial [Candidatus Nealsonbacteria bacterium RIFOXYC1_FULL_40_7]
KINSLEKEFEGLEDLKVKTLEFKERIKNGESLDDILPEAFALARESSKRNLSQRHYDVQLIAGIVLHRGAIAEMKTGEGKTLSATLAVYLNALEGKGAHVITVNDYLSRRDAVWMGQIYDALGLSVSCLNHEQSFIYDASFKKEDKDIMRDELGSFKVIEDFLRPVSRKEAYLADITYGTNHEFGFDYLRDNMAYDLKEQSQRGFHFAIVDEVDSILIDEARTPLIISSPTNESTDKYYQFADIVKNLKKEEDYIIEEKERSAVFTEEGQNKIIKRIKTDPWAENDIAATHQLESALKAKTLFEKDKDYVVKQGEVIIVDSFTGRLMPGRRWSGGLHQAVEAKEGVKVNQESKTFASITFQNYFRMYKKLSGMTGTASTSAEEFDKVYGLEVIQIPTNKEIVRKDLPDKIYKSEEGKFKAVVEEIRKRHEIGQPVLAGTVSIEKNEYLGKLLEREGVPHKILNAKHHEEEGEIIAQAGKFGSVTIATNMAGRGVDIILGGNPPEDQEKVKEAGGLLVIGTERHEARRIDDQLRGRSGRQGDPGSSIFFVSLEDDLMRVFGGDRVKGIVSALKIPEDQPIESRMVSKAIESAQAKIEGMNFDIRKHVLEYDDVMNKHREVFYKKRKEVLENFEKGTLKDYILGVVSKYGFSEEDYSKREEKIGKDSMRNIERTVCLRVFDFLWIEHLENMSYLMDSVRLRAFGQQDPLIEYKSEGHKMFQKMLENMESSIADALMKAEVEIKQKPFADWKPKAEPKVGRNDPCPCGAKHPDGRSIKYKHCHGKNA